MDDVDRPRPRRGMAPAEADDVLVEAEEPRTDAGEVAWRGLRGGS